MYQKTWKNKIKNICCICQKSLIKLNRIIETLNFDYKVIKFNFYNSLGQNHFDCYFNVFFNFQRGTHSQLLYKMGRTPVRI